MCLYDEKKRPSTKDLQAIQPHDAKTIQSLNKFSKCEVIASRNGGKVNN